VHSALAGENPRQTQLPIQCPAKGNFAFSTAPATLVDRLRWGPPGVRGVSRSSARRLLDENSSRNGVRLLGRPLASHARAPVSGGMDPFQINPESHADLRFVSAESRYAANGVNGCHWDPLPARALDARHSLQSRFSRRRVVLAFQPGIWAEVVPRRSGVRWGSVGIALGGCRASSAGHSQGRSGGQRAKNARKPHRLAFMLHPLFTKPAVARCPPNTNNAAPNVPPSSRSIPPPWWRFEGDGSHIFVPGLTAAKQIPTNGNGRGCGHGWSMYNRDRIPGSEAMPSASMVTRPSRRRRVFGGLGPCRLRRCLHTCVRSRRCSNYNARFVAAQLQNAARRRARLVPLFAHRSPARPTCERAYPR